jgi:twinkle protein
MARFLPDTIDFSAYERDTEASAKVRPASIFLADLLEELHPTREHARAPSMFLRKLQGRLEFRPGEVTLWAGYSKHRKSMFTGQVMLDLCAQRQRALCMSLEMFPHKTLRRMAQQAFGIAVPSSSALQAFSAWTDNRLWLFDHVGRLTPGKCIAVCRYFVQELGGQHVFIDSMMMVVASEKDLDEQKQFGTDLVRFAQEAGCHVHLIAHCRKPDGADESQAPTKYSIRGSAALVDQVHNIVTIWANKERKRRLEKNCNDHEAAAMPDAVVSIEGQRDATYEGKVQLWFDEASLRFTDERTTPIEPYAIDFVRPAT